MNSSTLVGRASVIALLALTVPSTVLGAQEVRRRTGSVPIAAPVTTTPTLAVSPMKPAGAGPTTASASPLSPFWVRLRWSPVPGAIGYTIVVDPARNPQRLVASPTTQTFFDHATQPSSTLTYAVFAEYPPDAPTGPGSSGHLTVTTPRAIQPTGFRATAGTSGIVTLDWQPVRHGPALNELVSYQVFRDGALVFQTGSVQPLKPSTPATTFQDRNVPEGVRHYTLVVRYPAPAGLTEGESPFPTAQVTVPRWKGRYRISVLGFRVEHETQDHLLHADGPGDEARLVVHVAEYDPRRPTVVTASPVLSPVYSSLTTGFAVPFGLNPASVGSPPLLRLWEGELAENGNVVFLTPTVWEIDNEDSHLVHWLKQFDSPSTPACVIDWSTLLAGLVHTQRLHAGGYIPLPSQCHYFAPGTGGISGIAPAHDRAVGERGSGPSAKLTPMNVPVTFRAAEAALGATSVVGPVGLGVLPITYRDEHGEGHYILYLRVERL